MFFEKYCQTHESWAQFQFHRLWKCKIVNRVTERREPPAKLLVMVAEIFSLVPEHFRGPDRGCLARYIEKGVGCACRGYDPGAWSRLKHQPKFHI